MHTRWTPLHSRRPPAHRPREPAGPAQQLAHVRALIVTAWIHDDDLYPFHRLRERFFPRNRTFVSAHCTLFHHLPGDSRDAVVEVVRGSVRAFRQNRMTPGQTALDVSVTGVFHMGRGVAYALAPDNLQRLRAPVAERFAGRLNRQDAGRWRNPHITVQNKATPTASKRLHRHLARCFTPCSVRVLGLQVWRYVGGPWAEEAEVSFADA